MLAELLPLLGDLSVGALVCAEDELIPRLLGVLNLSDSAFEPLPLLSCVRLDALPFHAQFQLYFLEAVGSRVLHLRLVVDFEHAVLVVPQLISELGYLRGLLAKDALGLRFNQVDSVHSF